MAYTWCVVSFSNPHTYAMFSFYIHSYTTYLTVLNNCCAYCLLMDVRQEMCHCKCNYYTDRLNPAGNAVASVSLFSLTFKPHDLQPWPIGHDHSCPVTEGLKVRNVVSGTPGKGSSRLKIKHYALSDVRFEFVDLVVIQSFKKASLRTAL